MFVIAGPSGHADDHDEGIKADRKDRSRPGAGGRIRVLVPALGTRLARRALHHSERQRRALEPGHGLGGGARRTDAGLATATYVGEHSLWTAVQADDGVDGRAGRARNPGGAAGRVHTRLRGPPGADAGRAAGSGAAGRPRRAFTEAALHRAPTGARRTRTAASLLCDLRPARIRAVSTASSGAMEQRHRAESLRSGASIAGADHRDRGIDHRILAAAEPRSKGRLHCIDRDLVGETVKLEAPS